MAPQGPNKILTAWLQQFCSGFASNDEEVLEMGSTAEMAALHQAMQLVSQVAGNPSWALENDRHGDLDTALRALLRLTRIRRNDSV